MNMPATAYPTRCPFLSVDCKTCSVRGGRNVLDTNRLRRSCQSDNFDNCPALLTYLLQHSQAKSNHCLFDEFQEK